MNRDKILTKYHSCRLKGKKSKSESYKDQSHECCWGKFSPTENTPRLKQEVLLKGVNVPDTGPLGLFKKSTYPLTKNGSKKEYPV